MYLPIRLEHLKYAVLDPRPYITSKSTLDKPWHVTHVHDTVSRVQPLKLPFEGAFPYSVLL